MISGSFEIRKVKPSDEKALNIFFKEINKVGANKYFHPHPMTNEHARFICQYEGYDLYYIITDNINVIGYGMLRGWDDGFDVPSLAMVIHPDYQQQGYGRLLMFFLHKAALLKGASKIRLKVYQHNISAYNLYKKLGYQFEQKEGAQLVGYKRLGDKF